MDFIFDLLKIFWPLLLIYAIGRVQRSLRTQKEREAKARQVPAEPEIQERLQRRAEILAAKQHKKQSPAQVAAPLQRQQPRPTLSQQPRPTLSQQPRPTLSQQPKPTLSQQPIDPYDEDKAEQLSEEDLIEKIGIVEYERRVEKGEIPAEGQHVSPAPRYTAEPHGNAATVLQTMPLRQFVIASEIFDKPRALRPHRPPFRS